MSRTVTPGATVAAIITLLVFAPPASADIVWSWSFGTEAGTFTTEGSPADLAAPVDLEIIDFQVTASSVPANVGDTYTVDDPDQGILWDGSQITQFYRSSGALTNGSNFTRTGYQYTLDLGVGILRNMPEEDNLVESGLSVAPTVGAPSIPGEGLALLLLLLLIGGTMLVRRYRAASLTRTKL